MIVVKVELWPGGDSTKARLMGIGTIANVGGTAGSGSYDAILMGATSAGVTHVVTTRPPFRRVAVTGFPRLRLCVWDLLYRVLHEAVGNRNGVRKQVASKTLAEGEQTA